MWTMPLESGVLLSDSILKLRTEISRASYQARWQSLLQARVGRHKQVLFRACCNIATERATCDSTRDANVWA